jgi:hypothetical protein
MHLYFCTQSHLTLMAEIAVAVLMAVKYFLFVYPYRRTRVRNVRLS